MTGPETRSLLDAARELAPKIRAAADEIEAERELPRAALRGPRRRRVLPHGGPALARRRRARPADLYPGARGAGQGGREHRVDDQPGRDLCDVRGAHAEATSPARSGSTRRAPSSPNTPAPTAKAVVVPGGYRVTGRQGFSTGCRHAAWVAAHAQVIDNGQVRIDPANGQPEARYLYVPVREAELLDTWHVRGMRGTGTHHFAVNDVFVPAERSVLSVTAPLFETGPLYQIPRTLLFASGDASVALGLARTCLETFFELAGAKTPRAMPGLLREQSMVQVDVGHAEANLRSGRAFLTEAVRDIWSERVRDRRGHARPARGASHRHDARDPARRPDHRHRLQCRRRHRRVREPSPPAPLPGHPRDQSAHAVADGRLRARGAVLARPPHRRTTPLISPQGVDEGPSASLAPSSGRST